MKMKTSRAVTLTIIAVLLAAYILFPFLLVVLNSFKTQSAIVSDPISAAGASFNQFVSNASSVINNKNFVFWHAFGSSALVTIISLVLLAVFGGMAAWVICRNKTRWSTVIYMVFISSMIIPFQVVMLPLIATFREVGKFVGPVSKVTKEGKVDLRFIVAVLLQVLLLDARLGGDLEDGLLLAFLGDHDVRFVFHVISSKG